MLARRAFSSTRRAPQARQKLRPSPTPALLRRPAFAPDSPFLPSTALVGTQWRPPVPPHQAPSFPILVPRTALAPALATRLGPPPADDPCDEIRVAQLDIWGARRDTKIRKLVPDQLPHRTPQRLRKAALLKQRWRDEERKMVQWRARLLKVTAIQENEAAAEQLRKQEHALNVKQWRADRKKLASSSTAPDSPPSLLARLFNFWPFAPAPPAPPKSP
ncbi:hypothetical protein PtB15_8B85 [Puccinia triticina]|nr:hypothetical protein PtB15_8B85 [Puccinia triticina]